LKGIREDILHSEVLPYGWRLNYLANYYSLIANRQLNKRFKTTRQEFVVLFCLANSSNVTAHDICEVTGRPKNTISRAISSLINKGCITKHSHSRDARAEIIRLEPNGKRLYDQIITIFEDRDRAMVAGLNAAERKTLKRLLDKMLESFNPWSEES
jgi:DNA-binding MarR family transcriptional regulator